jgi:tripartite-type tricarboxylate transporter receptor subunit TctC
MKCIMNGRHNPVRSARWAIMAAAVAVSLCLQYGASPAQDYPAHPITLVVPYPAGGGVDALARMIAPKLSDALGQQVVVENKAGAGGVIGTRAAARSAPDGYTIVLVPTGVSLLENTGYDLVKDFAPVILLSSSPIVLVAPPSLPAKTAADVIALAKAKPGKINAGTTPAPSINYFATELFKSMAGIDLAVVSYRGTAPLTNDLLGGHIELSFNTLAPTLGNIEAGKLNAIAVATTSRVAILPDVPTVSESGLPGFTAEFYYGLLAPANTPRSIIDRLYKELRLVVTSDDVSKRIAADGGVPIAGTPEDYAANIAREEAKWAAVAKKLGVGPN